MKSEMPFHGVSAPEVRRIAKEIFRDASFATARDWQNEVRAIFHLAKFREEKYAALALLHHRVAKPFRTMDALPLYEELIVAGAWWDIADDIAAHDVGPLLDVDPKGMARTLKAWSRSDDLWKRRTSIMCQVLRGEKTNVPLMYACIAPSLAAKDFWSRKAIGWALRAYAWVNPKEVARYVKEHDAELSGLSKREALKNIAKGKSRKKAS